MKHENIADIAKDYHENVCFVCGKTQAESGKKLDMYYLEYSTNGSCLCPEHSTGVPLCKNCKSGERILLESLICSNLKDNYRVRPCPPQRREEEEETDDDTLLQNPYVGMQECVAAIERHFVACQEERDALYVEDAFFEEWDTLVDALLTRKEFRTPYQNLIVEDAEEVTV